MKVQNSLAALLAVSSSYASADVALRGDCVEQIELAIASAEGAYSFDSSGKSITLDEDAIKAVTIENARKIGKHLNPAGTYDYTYRADVKSSHEGLEGSVVVTATRGGCVIKRINLHR